MSVGGVVVDLGPDRAVRRLVSAAVIVVALILAPTAYTTLTARPRIVDAGQLPDDIPVALVLGAAVNPDGTPSPSLRARLDLAVQLVAARRVHALLVSGDGSAGHNDEPAAMRSYLVEHGVAPSAITTDPAGVDTYASCVRASTVFGATRLVVVSQSYHLPRAITTCRAVGVDAWGVGDVSVRSNRVSWHLSWVREIGANVKMVWDLASHRQPRATP